MAALIVAGVVLKMNNENPHRRADTAPKNPPLMLTVFPREVSPPREVAGVERGVTR